MAETPNTPPIPDYAPPGKAPRAKRIIVTVVGIALLVAFVLAAHSLLKAWLMRGIDEGIS